MGSYLLAEVPAALHVRTHKDQGDHSNLNSEYVMHVDLRYFEACGKGREKAKEVVCQIDEAHGMNEKVKACYSVDKLGCWPS